MKIGIVGLGLIGGSFAKSYKKNKEIEIYAFDKDESIIEFAKIAGVVDCTLGADNIGFCDFIILALYPGDTIRYLQQNAKQIAKGCIVMDCCGVKTNVCEEGFRIANENGFSFIGGHPMAGTQYSGFKYSKDTLFQHASIILVPNNHNDLELLQTATNYLKLAGFEKITITTALVHDRMIAYTSQMPHLLSNAFIKSPQAMEHKGFSAGSYKDFTRVASLNEQMWAELFLENKEQLSKELDLYIHALLQYQSVLDAGDKEKLQNLLAEGKACKVEVDAKCRQ